MKVARSGKTTPLPKLSDLEWSDVAHALEHARRCGCSDVERHRASGLLQAVGTLLFGRTSPSEVSVARDDVVRRFICESSRRIPQAAERKTELQAIGFSLDQIAAMELLSR